MKFEQTDPDENFSVLRLQSSTWEMGIRRMLFGYRVSANPLGAICYSIDYCAADDTVFLLSLFVPILTILENLPDEIQGHEVEAMMPGYEVKPISKDLCWPKLLDLAERAKRDSI